MTPTHRHDDTNGRDHSVEREWTGPSREDWNGLISTVSQIPKISEDVCDIQKALWGVRRDGINDDGGIVGEVRKQRSVRTVAWSSICIAVSTAFALVTGWLWGKITKGGQ